MKPKDFAKIYLALLLAHLVLLDVGTDLALMRVTKALLLFSLLAYFASKTMGRQRHEKLFLVGLFFSWVGDILLMFTEQRELFFMLGLGAFLIAQLNYVLAFRAEVRGKDLLVGTKPWLAIPFVGYGVFFVWMLYPHLGALLIPVILYATVLTAMGVAALARVGGVAPRSASLVLIGAVLFIASDSLLAYAKFVGPFAYHQVLVMITYGLAQFALVWGMLFERQN